MKKIIAIFGILILFVSCEKPIECIESTGDIVKRIIPVTPFIKIKLYHGIELVVTQANEYKVEVESGSNLIDNIEISQNDNQLVIKDNTTCNWLRDYGQTKVYISAPNIEEIYSKTDRTISSNGALNFPKLTLYALDKNGDGENEAGTGDFYLTLNATQLNIESNNVSRYFLSGTVQEAYFNFWAGDSRIEASDLTIQNIHVYHRGSNDMIVKPIQSITGIMNSTGNIILKNNPPLIDVQQLYQGHVILN
ncbi:head GIN domain-containing protein [Flavobacterium aciduliphilum]|uniref:Putative autotransporter adhesin-like protein n=1 Tax=Flavobacterium aciduliphilum TaxID=1101402 RepID=A0A328YMT8_9FLAO|nr:head GIN domain-containing protein [Flavobacterium aciduliphilum]RAR74155.1 putative autotransporter adhesin-like protein [Flavobacterium aciduliphilum]